MIIWIYYTYFV